MRCLRVAAIALVVAGVGVGCGDDSAEPAATADGSTTTLTPTDGPDPADTTVTVSPGDTTTSSPATPDVATFLAEQGVGPLTLGATEPGPHPVLGWDPVEGAAGYWLTVRDADGAIHWAWTGTDTTVRFGGGDRAELNQTAAVHEPMTWTVTAVDADGAPLARSEPGELAP